MKINLIWSESNTPIFTVNLFVNENIYRNIVNGCRLGYSSSQPVASEGLLRDTVWKMKRLLLAAVTVGGGAPQDVNVEYPTYPWDVTTCLQTSAVSWLHWNRLLSVLKGRTQKNRIATCFLFCQFTIYICKMSKFLYQKKKSVQHVLSIRSFLSTKKTRKSHDSLDLGSDGVWTCQWV